jgi:hypothetical protein
MLERRNRGYALFRVGCPPRVHGAGRIEPKWVHGTRAIVEPARLLTAEVLRQRMCDYFGCEQIEHLVQHAEIPKQEECLRLAG